MKESFRWYGPRDPVTLQDISQTGATKVVSALHDIPNGEVWNKDAIKTHQQIIRNADLEWEVVESVPIHEEIKLRIGSFQNHIDNYKKIKAYTIKDAFFKFQLVIFFLTTGGFD